MTLSVHLGQLESAGLIQLASIQPELEYIFRHVLVKDAAYHSLVKSDRRALHQAVGETLERLYTSPAPNPIRGEFYPLLAFHFAGAGDAARAQRYYTLAGEAAAAAYANMEAAAHFAQAIQSAGQAGASSRDLVDLYTRLGRVQELSGNFDAALTSYGQLEALGVERGDPHIVLAAVILQAVVRAVPSAALDPIQADHLTMRALTLARELGDPATEARALWARMLYELLIEHAAEAVEAGEAALRIARELGRSEQIALTLVDIGRAYAGAGLMAQSRAALVEARQRWRSLGNQPMVAESLNDSAATDYFTGHYAEALALLDEAYEISTVAANAWGQAYSLMLRSFVYLEQGTLQKALETIDASLELAVAGGFLAPLIQVRDARGLLLANLGQFELAKSEVQAARRVAGDQPSPVLTDLLAIDANVHLLAGELEAAEALLAEARAQPAHSDLTTLAPMLEALADASLGLARGDNKRAAEAPAEMLAIERATGIYVLRVDLELARARGLMALGQLEEAGALLAEARSEAESKQIQRLLWEVLATQGELAERRGQGELAAVLRQRARTELENLAAQLADPVLRAGLLGQPAARTVLAGAPLPTGTPV
jgi:hypothetical protein